MIHPQQGQILLREFLIIEKGEKTWKNWTCSSSPGA